MLDSVRRSLVVATLMFGAAAAASAQPLLTTTRVAAGLNLPTWVGSPPGDTERLFVLEQTTAKIRIVLLASGQILAAPFLDLGPLVTGSGGEQGLLGMAFHPDYASNGTFFVNYSDNSGDTVIARFQVSADPNRADPASRQVVLAIDQPFANHNGGNLDFGPDGYLYIGMGDGGSANDPGNRAQNPGTLLGKMLRIDVDHGAPYSIPPDNPFVGAGDPLDEIWALGLRNPWRYSFDRVTGDLYIADVGQNSREEVDFQPAGTAGGENYGWRCMEGTACTGLSGCVCHSAELVQPIYDYDHSQGCSITGGFVYRGCAIPELQGTYFLGDFCSARIWSFRFSGGMVDDFQERTSELAPGGGLHIDSISSFGEDGAGEQYIADRGGEIFKIVPRAAPATLALASPPQIGTTATLVLSSLSHPNRSYLCGFALGTEPGIVLPDGRRVPLNFDELLEFSLQPNTVFLNFEGVLDGMGRAGLGVAIPDDPALRGVTVYGACAVLNPQDPLGVATLTCPLPMTIQ